MSSSVVPTLRPGQRHGRHAVVGIDQPLMVGVAAVGTIQFLAEVVEWKRVEETAPDKVLGLLVGVGVSALPARPAGAVELSTKQGASRLSDLDHDGQDLG